MAQSVPLFLSSLNALQAAHRLFKLLDHRPRIDGSINTGFMLPLRETCGVEFQEVSFVFSRWNRLPPAVQGLTFEIQEGEISAILGKSGSGKSTCLYLLERFYDPTDGVAMVDHIELQSLNVPWLRTQIALIQSDCLLPGRTIAENVTYGDNWRFSGMEDVVEACQTVGVHSFIQSLPLGYETVIEEDSTDLSPVQKLLIALARAILRNPRIFLLDDVLPEASSEDFQTLLRTLTNLLQGKTCIITSHQAAIGAYVNRVLVLSHGRCVEKGEHMALMDLNGRYCRQWKREESKRLERDNEVETESETEEEGPKV